MKGMRISRLLRLCPAVMLSAMGCARSLPPEIPAFHAAALPVPKSEIKITLPAAPQAAAPAPEKPKIVEAPKVVASKPVEAPPPPKVEEQPKQAVPTVIGSWRIVKMNRGGQEQPMPPGAEMILTFEEGGKLSMKMSMPQMPEPQSMEGTWKLDGDQLTATMQGETKTGTLTLDGDRLKLDIDGGQMELERM